jgi:hypothetical protein
MRIKELLNENTILQFPGSGVDNPSVKIPKGYDRFELDHTAGRNVASIVGINGARKVRISAGPVELMRELVKVYNGGKSSVQLEPKSVMQATGSDEINALSGLNKKMCEKPGYWSELSDDDCTIDEVAVKRLEKALKKTLPVYTGHDVYGPAGRPKNPQAEVRTMPSEMMFIIDIDGDRYLVDRTGANSYIRSWLRIR